LGEQSREVGGLVSWRSVDILGVRVSDVTEAESVAAVREMLAAGGCNRIVTPNSEIVMRARRDPAFREVLNDSALAIPDGIGLLLAGRLLGTPLRDAVQGTDLAIWLAGVCAETGRRLFLLGAAEGVADEAAAALRRRFPTLVIAGTYAGTADPAGDTVARERIRAAAPVDALLVAYGAPKQEYWMARNQREVGVTVAIGVGGALDFIAGRVPRAPRWVRRSGFDWLYRLIKQPWRWRRQLALPRFLLTVAWSALRRGDRKTASDRRRGG
jgi:N-acetylglucosaminyldiphosphoundecaprenol N-acetyl-beta-D-mannosaminyltransferase